MAVSTGLRYKKNLIVERFRSLLLKLAELMEHQISISGWSFEKECDFGVNRNTKLMLLLDIV
jgi:hypothetical protein